MITLKLTDLFVPQGSEPKTIVVTFDVPTIDEPAAPQYIQGEPVNYQGQVDQYGHMHDDIISPDSFAHIAGCIGYEVEYVNEGVE